MLTCDSYYIRACLFIGPMIGSGLSDYGITCRVNGKLTSTGINNIQELTTFVLRCYY